MSTRYSAMAALVAVAGCGGTAAPESPHPSPLATHVTQAVDSLVAARAGTLQLDAPDRLFLGRMIDRYEGAIQIAQYARHRRVAAAHRDIFAVQGKWTLEQQSLRDVLHGGRLGGNAAPEGYPADRKPAWDALPQATVGDSLVAAVLAHHDGTLRFVDSMVPVLGPDIAAIARAVRIEREEERVSLTGLLGAR